MQCRTIIRQLKIVSSRTQVSTHYRYAEEEANGTRSDQVSTFEKTAVHQNYATNRLHSPINTAKTC